MFTRADFLQLDSFAEIQKLSWRDFEWFSKFFLEAWGYEKVSVTKPKYDEGIDNTAYKNGKKVLAQVKRYNVKNHLSVKVVRELAGVMKRKNVDKGIVITTGIAYATALKEAADLDIEIIDLHRLQRGMKKLNPDFDDRVAIEHKKEKTDTLEDEGEKKGVSIKNLNRFAKVLIEILLFLFFIFWLWVKFYN